MRTLVSRNRPTVSEIGLSGNAKLPLSNAGPGIQSLFPEIADYFPKMFLFTDNILENGTIEKQNSTRIKETNPKSMLFYTPNFLFVLISHS
jgi:hypothetical protein